MFVNRDTSSLWMDAIANGNTYDGEMHCIRPDNLPFKVQRFLACSLMQACASRLAVS